MDIFKNIDKMENFTNELESITKASRWREGLQRSRMKTSTKATRSPAETMVRGNFISILAINQQL